MSNKLATDPIFCYACSVCRRVLKNRAEVPKPLLLEDKELVHSTDGKKYSMHNSKGLAIGENILLSMLVMSTYFTAPLP